MHSSSRFPPPSVLAAVLLLGMPLVCAGGIPGPLVVAGLLLGHRLAWQWCRFFALAFGIILPIIGVVFLVRGLKFETHEWLLARRPERSLP